MYGCNHTGGDLLSCIDTMAKCKFFIRAVLMLAMLPGSGVSEISDMIKAQVPREVRLRNRGGPSFHYLHLLIPIIWVVILLIYILGLFLYYRRKVAKEFSHQLLAVAVHSDDSAGNIHNNESAHHFKSVDDKLSGVSGPRQSIGLSVVDMSPSTLT